MDPIPPPTQPVTPTPIVTKERWHRLLKLIAIWLSAAAVVWILQHYIFQPYQVFGHSMEPTLSEGDYLVISKVGLTWSSLFNHDYVPNRGDIIVIRSPLDGTRLIKRVIGLPGERIKVDAGNVKVFNSDHPEGFDPYQELGLPARPASGELTLVVPAEHIFVIGDNREAGGSFDSRSELGPIPVDDVLGRLVVRLYPFTKIDTF